MTTTETSGRVVAGAGRHHGGQDNPVERPGISGGGYAEGDDPADLLVVARVYFELVAQANARFLQLADGGV